VRQPALIDCRIKVLAPGSGPGAAAGGAIHIYDVVSL
jgi:hypothetical protein